MDKYEYPLQEALRVWNLAVRASTAEKIELAQGLHRLQVFSLTQLAKICRVSVPTLSRRMTANAGGGRFAPETLTLMLQIRKMLCANQEIPRSLLRAADEAGTSVNTIAKLTGASYSTLYKTRLGDRAS